MTILQANILVWVAMPSSRGSSQPRDRTQVSQIAGRFFTSWATQEILVHPKRGILSIKKGNTAEYLQGKDAHDLLKGERLSQ